MSGSVTISFYIDKYLKVDSPFIIPGASPGSASASEAKNSEQQHLKRLKHKYWSNKIPKINKEHCIWSNALIDSLRKHNIEIDDYSGLYSRLLLSHPRYYKKINLVITRSGSSVLAELLNCKIPFVSVPLPTSADNHQLKNAIYYEKNGYSYLIEEKNLNTKLFQLIKKISEDTSLLSQISSKQRQYSDKSVYENIDNQINKIINEEH